MKHLNDIINKLKEFRDERDWQQFHNSKDLAIAINLEASELLELFLWKDNEDFNKENLKDELADIFTFSLLLADKHDLNVLEIIEEKINKNAKKYPIDKAKGNAKKYDEL
jgi:NTP pyrophosphatase (non-canonical NTP hydrolase)